MMYVHMHIPRRAHWQCIGVVVISDGRYNNTIAVAYCRSWRVGRVMLTAVRCERRVAPGRIMS